MNKRFSFPKTFLHEIYQRENINGPFILADLGLTNGGNLNTALELIKIAAELQVDAVKFQMLDADELINNKEVEYTYPTILHGNKTENMVRMFKGLEFSDKEWAKIKSYCDECGIGLIITSHVESAVARISMLDLPVNKICTWSLSHWRMIEKLAENGKPLIIDTGTLDQKELDELDKFYKSAGGGELIVLYDFHTTDSNDRNMGGISSLKSQGYHVGYTPQGRDDWLDFMSLGLGATILEKRLTISRIRPSNGHWKAHEPSEFSQWMKEVRDCYMAIGKNELVATQQDLEGATKWYKSAFLVKTVKSGELIKQEHFEFKRPGSGVSSKSIYQNWVGKEFNRSYDVGEMFEG